MLTRIPIILIAKTARLIVRIKGGHGSALPGYLVEKIDPKFLKKSLATLNRGVVLVTGTNGKTTTSRMLVNLLQDQGLKVLTNPSGSNLTRGLISTVVENIKISGKLPYDIAVFEIDEAYSPKFANQVSPSMLVALNVMRDQLDRYGELETTATYIQKAANKSEQTLINAHDRILVDKMGDQSRVSFFGADDKIASQISSEASISKNLSEEGHTGDFIAKITSVNESDSHQDFEIRLSKDTINARLPLLGLHNILNVSAAIGAAKLILGNALDLSKIKESLMRLSPAFGRGETLEINKKEFTIALVKNPSGFTQNLRTYSKLSSIKNILIVINDNYADGRDVSWLWDVDISYLKSFSGKVFVGGSRRFDMALCLKYQNLECKVIDTDDLGKMMDDMVNRATIEHTLIVPTYTAMLEIRKYFGKQLGVKKIW